MSQDSLSQVSPDGLYRGVRHSPKHRATRLKTRLGKKRNVLLRVQARSQGTQQAREGTESYGSAAPQHFHPMHQGMHSRELPRHRGLPDLSRAEMGMYDSPLRHCERPVLQCRHPHELQVQPYFILFLPRFTLPCLVNAVLWPLGACGLLRCGLPQKHLKQGCEHRPACLKPASFRPVELCRALQSSL